MVQGIRWRFGDSRSIRVFTDPWLDDTSNFFIEPTSLLGLDMLPACDLLNETGIFWDKELIDGFLAPGFEGVGSYVVVVHGGDGCLGQGRDCAPVVNSTWLAHFAAIGWRRRDDIYCGSHLLCCGGLEQAWGVVQALSGFILTSCDACLAKVMSIQEAFSWLKDQGMDNIVVETDCREVVLALRSNNENLSFSWVKRVINQVAHQLDRVTSFYANSLVHATIPLCLCDIVMDDVTM
ncbi:hypothetical protein Gohar_005005 [Gossypium harknessii]|uniref:RNase H type-1 domain-containing protein n=1 Tax=Gossypium harknessii TaxID=34285 RepID=A0A7J9H6Y9_9ROSI|nr:hypothetical protein [Gossypium harknessii]